MNDFIDSAGDRVFERMAEGLDEEHLDLLDRAICNLKYEIRKSLHED